MYTKNGSIPKPETDGTEGWLEVPNPPEVPDGKELVWLNWEWVGIVTGKQIGRAHV